MNYVESFDLFGVEAKQIPCITGAGAPTTTTEGAVGCLYMDTNTGALYKCIAVTDGIYTWVALGEQAAATDAKYFDITEDGLLSLKQPYRGACASSSYTYAISDNGVGNVGSLNHELPEDIVIPDMVGDIAVTALAQGMIRTNHRVKRLTLPSWLTEIPKAMCYEAINLEELNGTEGVKIIRQAAFTKTALKKAFFPNLQTLDSTQHFCQSPKLAVVDLGGAVTNLPKRLFWQCVSLSAVHGAENVTSVGDETFLNTQKLKNLSFIPNLTAIGNNAFHLSRLNYDWWSDGKTFDGTRPTPESINPTNYWSECTYTDCETPMLSTFAQGNPAWADKPIGTSGTKYGSGCGTVSAAMIYSALKGLSMDSPERFVEAVQAVDPTLVGENAVFTLSHIGNMLSAVGLSVTRYDRYNTANLQTMYNALAEGALVLTGIIGEAGATEGHAIVLHGIKDNGEVLCVDPSCKYDNIGIYTEAMRYAMPIQNMVQFVGDGQDACESFLIVRNN